MDKKPTIEEMSAELRAKGKAAFLKPSKVKKVMYHGTNKDFNEFQNSHRGASFLTPKPEFANKFIENPRNDRLGRQQVMPVHVQVKNPFNYKNRKHMQALKDLVRNEPSLQNVVSRMYDDRNNWQYMEDPEIQHLIKHLGHDSFYVNEQGTKNLGVYDPKKIKSAIGNRGTYDVNDPDITKAKGGRVKEPKNTVKAYKLFRVHEKHPGKLFPLFVDANTPVEMGKWVDAKEGEMSNGKVKSKIGALAYRPGWHAGDLPIATHIGEKSDPSLTAPDMRPANHAWAEVEMPHDVDWQSEANKRGTNAQGKLVPVKAHITDQIPKGGHYRYKTNPNMTGNWLIGGSMKVNRVLTDKEVEKINKAAGLSDLPRAQPFKKKQFGFASGGCVAPDEWKAEEHVNHRINRGIIHKAEGGSMNTPTLAQMRLKINQRNNPDYMDSIGVNQAVDMTPKTYINPSPSQKGFVPVGGVSDQNGLPVGGIDQNNTQPGQQMMFAPQRQNQDGQPNPAPEGAEGEQPGGYENNSQQSPTPPMGGLLSMTPQGQKMQAMAPTGMAKGGKVDRRPFENSVQRNLRQLRNGTYNAPMSVEEKMREEMKQRLLQEKAAKEGMAKGGKVSPQQMAAIKAKMMMGRTKKYAEGGNVDAPYSETEKPGRILFHGKGHGQTKGIIVPRHMWEGSEGVYEKGKKKGETFKIDGMGEINKARANVYGSESRDPLTIGQIGRVHKNVLDEHFQKPIKEQMAAEDEALNRLRAARHIGEGANTLDESEKLDTVKHERDAQGRSHVGYAAKGVAGHSLYTSGHGDNMEHHIINTCPGQTVGCGGGHDENGIVDTMKGSCFAPNAESQYVSAAIRRACHEQAKHDPKMTRDWILAHTGSLRKVSDTADKKNVRTLFRPNVVDETDTSSRHVIRHLNKQRTAKGKPDIISNQYGKTNELHDPENGYYVTHSNIGPKVKNGMSIAENIARDKQRVRSTITATEASGKDFTNEQGNKTPPKGSYFVTDVKRKSPMQKEMEKHIKHIKYWSTGRPLNELSKEEKAEEEEGHFDGSGNPTTEDKAHFGHMTFDGKRYDYQKQHVLHPRLVNVPERKENKDTGKMETVEHMIPTDSRFMDEQFLPKKRFKTKNGKVAGHILMTTPTESTSNVGHETTFTHHVGEHNIDYAKRNKGEYEVDSPMHQAMAEGKEYIKPEPIKIVRKVKAVKKAKGGSVSFMPHDYDDDFNCFPERNYIAQHHLANRAGVEDETELPESLLQRPKD
jgi:hypothetical protein